MSKARALNAIQLQLTDRIPQWDFPDNPGVASSLFTYDIWEDTERSVVDLWKHFDIDLAHYLPGGVAEWNFPFVRYYDEVSFVDDPSCVPYQRAYPAQEHKPYRSMYDALGRSSVGAYWGMAPTLSMRYTAYDIDEVLAFHPCAVDTATLAERTQFFKSYYARQQALLGEDCLMMGWYYHTLFMWTLEVFGWEGCLLAAMEDPDRYRSLLGEFFALTKRDLAAMCQVADLPVIACHDDICTATGPVFPPDWYREMIFPAYKELFAMIHDAGKKVLFVSDGNVLPLLDDLRETGADGIAVDGHTDLRAVVDAFHGKIIAGGMKPTVLSHGTPNEIVQHVQETVSIVRDEPGYFFQCPAMNGLTSVENVLAYQDAIRAYGQR